MSRTYDDGFRPVINPHALVARAHPEAFKLYRAGAQLNVWRNSSPHNWWLEQPGRRGDTMVFHWPERSRPEEAFFLFSRRLTASEQKVSYGGWMRGGDEGQSVSEVWAFDDTVLQAHVERWERALACAKTFNERLGTAAVEPMTLVPYQRQVLRALKRGQTHPMWPDIKLGERVGFGREEDVDLCARGLAEVDPAGYLRATELLRRTTIPSEKTYASLIPGSL